MPGSGGTTLPPENEFAAGSTGSVEAVPAQGSSPPGLAELAGRIGPYRLLKPLGRGGQGEVYLAEDTRLQRLVALKVLARAFGDTDAALQRFRREAAAASRLDHPGICGILDVGTADGVHYLALRLVEGETLAAGIGLRRERASARGSTSATRAELLKIVAFFEKAARALHAAHEAGLVHRDIKPGNIMVTSADDPVILDFGLARDVDGVLPVLTQTGDLLGTPAYMSPEQLLAQRVPLDHRTDVYSLGVTLYEALTLERPFDSPTREGLYQKILASDAPDSRRKNPQIPRDLAVVVETAMEKDRDRRYQTALEFAEDLRRVREVEPIRARPAGALLKLRRWVERKPALAVAVFGMILSMAAGLTTSLVLLDRAIQESDEKSRALAEKGQALESLRSETTLKEAALRAVSLERDEKSKALLRAEGLHLASLSTAALERDPALALLLGVEAGKKHRSELTLGTVNAALASLRELKTLIAPGSGETGPRGSATDSSERGAPSQAPASPAELLEISPDGTRVFASHADGLVRSWDAGSGELLLVFAGHSNPITSLSLSPDGARLATASAGSTVRVWDARSGRAQLTLREFRGIVDSTCFSPDSSRLLLGCRDGTAAIWDVVEGREIQHLEWQSVRGEKAQKTAVAFSKDGKRAWTAWKPQELAIWDVESGRRVLALSGFHDFAISPDWRYVCEIEFEDAATPLARGIARVHDTLGEGPLLELEYVQCAAFDSRGDLATATAGGRITVRSLAAPGEIVSLDAGDPISELYFVRDDKMLLARRSFGQWTLWSRGSGKKVLESASMSFSPDKDAVVWISPDAQLFAAGSSAIGMVVWSGGTTKESLRTIVRPHNSIASAHFFPAGDKLATTSRDGSIHLWDIRPAAEIAERIDRFSNLERSELSADGKLASAFSPASDSLLLLDTRTRETLHTLKLPGEALCPGSGLFSPDGRMVLTTSANRAMRSRTARTWSTETGAELCSFTLEDDLVFLEDNVTFSKDGRFLLHLVRRSSMLRAFDARTGSEVWSVGGAQAFQSSPDGLRLAVIGEGKSLRLLDAGSGKSIAELRTSSKSSFSPDGRSLAVSVESGQTQSILMLDATTGFERHATAGRSFCWSPDSRRFICETANGVISALDTHTGAPVKRLEGLKGKINSLECHPDGRRVLVAGVSDLRLWNLDSGEAIDLPGRKGQFLSAEISPDGRHLLTVAREPTDYISRGQVRDGESGEILFTLERAQLLRFSQDSRWIEEVFQRSVRRFPIDPMDSALPRRPRELTPGERDSHEIGSPAERDLYRRRYTFNLVARDLEAIARASAASPLPTRAVTVACSYVDALSKLLEGTSELDTGKLLASVRALEAGQSSDDPEILLACGTAHAALGRAREGLVSLEKAARASGASGRASVRLEELRRRNAKTLCTPGSVDALLESPLELVPGSQAWRFFRGKAEPSPALEWTEAAFPDSEWESGQASTGYGDGDDATLLTDMRGTYTTVYLRAKFLAPPADQLRNLRLRVDADDGFVAYLNGAEVGRARAGAKGLRLGHGALASEQAPEPLRSERIDLDPRELREGENVLALQGVNRELDSSDFTLAAILEAEWIPGAPGSAERARELVAQISGESATGAKLYLEARLLEKAGKPLEAAAKFEQLLALDPDTPEALRHLTVCLRAVGPPAAVAERLRAGLAHSAHWTRELWDAYLEACFRDLGWTAGRALESMPAVASPLVRGPEADVRWALERLHHGEALRILCGGNQDRGSGSNAWSRDRFHLGGQIRLEDDHWSPTRRYFSAAPGGPSGYRVPLPRGRYRLAIHLAPAEDGSQLATLVVLNVEGQTLSESWSSPPDRGGFSASRVCEIDVTDGALDVEFIVPRGEAAISGIEISQATLSR